MCHVKCVVCSTIAVAHRETGGGGAPSDLRFGEGDRQIAGFIAVMAGHYHRFCQDRFEKHVSFNFEAITFTSPDAFGCDSDPYDPLFFQKGFHNV